MGIGLGSTQICKLFGRKHVKSVACLAACAAIMSISVGASAGEITIRQFASSAPNAAGSSSWAGYVANAMNSLQNSPGTPEGSAEQPTYYSTLGNTFTAADAMVTSFHSWKGQADPAAPFANELGNRIHSGSSSPRPAERSLWPM